MKDPISTGDYRREEDPKLFVSQTGRGPLDDDWREQLSTELREKGPGSCALMCAYKVCRVEFKYWGMQGKLERFIHDIGECADTDFMQIISPRPRPFVTSEP